MVVARPAAMPVAAMPVAAAAAVAARKLRRVSAEPARGLVSIVDDQSVLSGV
jgi:hypothetical protein